MLISLKFSFKLSGQRVNKPICIDMFIETLLWLQWQSYETCKSSQTTCSDKNVIAARKWHLSLSPTSAVQFLCIYTQCNPIWDQDRGCCCFFVSAWRIAVLRNVCSLYMQVQGNVLCTLYQFPLLVPEGRPRWYNTANYWKWTLTAIPLTLYQPMTHICVRI